MTNKQDPLGPLQPAYDTWSEVQEQVLDKPLSHFMPTITIQMLEVYEHVASGRVDKAINEVVDILSVSLNWLRWFGLDDVEIAEAIRARTATRYEGKAQEILDKYAATWGI